MTNRILVFMGFLLFVLVFATSCTLQESTITINCNKITDDLEKAKCVQNAAVLFGDSSLCNETNIQVIKDKCIELVSEKKEFCSETKEGKREIVSLGEKLNSICDSKKNSFEAVNCKRDFAILIEDTDLCDKISPKPLPEAKKECKAVIKKDIDLCLDENGNFEELTSEACIYTFWEHYPINYIEDCEYPNKAIKDRCLSRIASKNRDPNICLKISDTKTKNSCFAGVAWDESGCEEFSGEIVRICKESIRAYIGGFA